LITGALLNRAQLLLNRVVFERPLAEICQVTDGRDLCCGAANAAVELRRGGGAAPALFARDNRQVGGALLRRRKKLNQNKPGLAKIGDCPIHR
jgi:hypothetical protein